MIRSEGDDVHPVRHVHHHKIALPTANRMAVARAKHIEHLAAGVQMLADLLPADRCDGVGQVFHADTKKPPRRQVEEALTKK